MTPGLRIGKYEVAERLGKGSFGVVHLARDVELGREVAIKFLRPEFGAREQIVQRFLQEARAAAKIGHPGIVTVFECGVVSGNGRHDGTAYIVMERLQGQSLGDRIEAKHAWTYQTIVAIGRQLALALKAAHDSGIIHRDLKPDNVFLVPDAAVVGGERAKILDFGIAKLDDPGPGGMHTHSKMILGTPRYMSPEQARSSTNIDARSDIYALGCMFYELVTGRAPFEGDTGDIMFHHQATDVPPITTLVDNAPAKLDALLRQMLEKKPDKRPPNMQAIDTALAAIDADAVKPAIRNRARFVTSPVTTDVAEPPRPKRISAAGELSTKPVEDKPPERDSGRSDLERVKVDLDAVPSPSEEHTAPSQRVAMLMARASQPTFKAIRHEVFEHAEPTARDLQPAANSTLRTQRTGTNAVWFAAAGGVLLLLAVVMIVRCSGGGTKQAVTSPPDAAARPPDATVDEDRLALDKECQDARTKRAWDKLDKCGRELARTSPEAGKAMMALAFEEASAKLELDSLVRLDADLGQATIHARAIPPASTYRSEAMTELARVRTAYVAQQRAALAGYAEAHDCGAHDYVLTSIENAHGRPLRDDIERTAQPCTPGDHAPDPKPDTRVIRKPPKPRVEPVTVKAEPKPCADAAATAETEAKGDESMASGSYAAALGFFEVAFRCKPAIARKAYLAACKARNFPKARIYFRFTGQDTLAQICMKEGFDPH